jgi:Zn-dependent protease
MSADRRARFWRGLVLNTAAVLVFIVSFYTAAFFLAAFNMNDPRRVVVLSLVISVVFSAICVLVHELGHAVAAQAMGWRVHLIVVGSWAFAPRRGRFIRIRDSDYGQDLGGWVNATPPPGTAWTNGDIPFILGGAVGNLLLAAVSALAALAIHGTGPHVFAGLMGLAGISMVFAVANLVPLRGPGSHRNDGALLIDALKREEPPLRAQNIARLIGSLFDGLPVAQWDASRLNELAEDPSIDREVADSLLLSYALTVADLDAVRQILERTLAENPDADPEDRCQYAFVIAMIDRDGPRAAEILDAVPREAVEESFTFWRAQAVTSHLLGTRDAALAAIAEARRVGERLGIWPDADDEAVFRAITLGEELPRLEPRGRISADLTAPRGARRGAGAGRSAVDP